MKFLKLIAVACFCATVCSAQVIPINQANGGATAAIVGQIQTATGGTVNHGTLTFTLSQPAVAVGTATLVTQPTACYTSTLGNVVGLPDPLVPPVLSVNTASGTLPAATYYVVIYYLNTGGYVSAVSPEASIILGSAGTLNVNAPILQPSGAAGYGIAISTASGAETIQNNIIGWTQFHQSIPLVTGTNPLAVNDSICNLYFSDQLIPTGTSYTVNLVNRNGSQISGFPQTWCTYGGASGVINVSQGAPTGNCGTTGVYYPTPILASPTNISTQTVASPIAFPGGVVGNTTFTGSNNLCLSNGVATVGPGCNSVWGTGDVGTQINAAIGVCGQSCDIHIPAGLYVYTTTVTIPSLAITIHGDGSRSTHLWYTGTGDAFVIQPSPYSVTEAGLVSGFTLDGSTNPGTQISGFHVINTNQFKFYDVTVRSFTGLSGNQGSGWWMDNQSSVWSERITCVDCFSWGNRKGWRFTQNGGTNSFARFHCIACYVNVESAQTGISAENGANVYDSNFDISGNIDAGGTPGTLISIDGTSVMEGQFSVRAESDINGATCISMASGATLTGEGLIDCSNSPNTVSNSINAGAHFLLIGGHDPLQPTFSNSGVGPWLFPGTINGQEGIGFNARPDAGSNWLINGDGTNNGGAIALSNNATGELDFYSVGTTSGANKSVTNSALANGLLASLQLSGLRFPVPLMSTGTAAALTGTGACATITTQSGGSWAGSAKCTGSTAASTLIITPGFTAPNGWVCSVFDETTRANLFQQTSHSATACTLTVTSVTSNDVFVFTATAF